MVKKDAQDIERIKYTVDIDNHPKTHQGLVGGKMVCASNGLMIGRSGYHPCENNNTVATLYSNRCVPLWVEEEFWGNGIGTEIFRGVCVNAAKDGFSKLIFYENVPYARFYEKCLRKFNGEEIDAYRIIHLDVGCKEVSNIPDGGDDGDRFKFMVVLKPTENI